MAAAESTNPNEGDDHEVLCGHGHSDPSLAHGGGGKLDQGVFWGFSRVRVHETFLRGLGFGSLF